MNRQAVLDVLNSLEVVETNGGDSPYILVENNEIVRQKLNAVGITNEVINQYGDDDSFDVLSLAFAEGYTDYYEKGKFVLWGPIDDELRDRVRNGEGTTEDAERLLKEFARYENEGKPEIDWHKTSNTQIEVNKAYCPRCHKPFHEIDGYELDSCPNCEMTLYGENISWDEQVLVRIYVDHKTGELKVWGTDSDD
ncbi:zf-TFIIB domain-containing protein [Brevibacillus fortis]|uniref:TFIIB-type zinc ribbon-containing protein n=1 Tax=Brevibacillus fortis TaxID=2126352 RepID=UPI001FC9235A|nr:zf-TFIIB domain-containing protein [Brevibacillus fortis]